MLLTRTYYPLGSWRGAMAEMDRLRQEMNRVLGNMGGGFGETSSAGVYPLTNVSEDADNYVVRSEVPGLSPADIEISVVGKNLSISGERKLPEISDKAKYHRREREFLSFSRALTLPGDVQTDKVKAACKDGVLTITLPKAEECKPRQISVQAS